MRIYYSITTLEPVILSQNSGTASQHECMDYIPGSAILGALAAKLYSKIDAEKSWKIFHSGMVRFSPCYAIVDNQIALPIPASWHIKKGDTSVMADGYLRTGAISNQSHESYSRTAGIQYKQLRNGYVNSKGRTATVLSNFTTRTALNKLTGIAKESQLFSYAYLEEGQSFAGWIDSEDPDLIEVIKPLLSQESRLGRSKNTEFGRVELQIVNPIAHEVSAEIQDKQLTLWCLSDAECLDNEGLPTFTPALDTILPLAKGSLNLTRTFIRTSKKTHYNQKRQGPDSQQSLICKGSVLVYELDQPLEKDAIDLLNRSGIGINRQQGLGWVLVNPLWSHQTDLQKGAVFTALEIDTKEQASIVNSTPDTPLTRWLHSKVTKQQSNEHEKHEVERLLTEIGCAYRNARRYNNIINSNEAGPTSSQWQRINDELRNANPDWLNALFDEEHGICKARNDEYGWGINWSLDGNLINFASYLRQLLTEQNRGVLMALLSRINRYDMSTYHGLKKAACQLNFSLEAQSVVEGGK